MNFFSSSKSNSLVKDDMNDSHHSLQSGRISINSIGESTTSVPSSVIDSYFKASVPGLSLLPASSPNQYDQQPTSSPITTARSSYEQQALSPRGNITPRLSVTPRGVQRASSDRTTMGTASEDSGLSFERLSLNDSQYNNAMLNDLGRQSFESNEMLPNFPVYREHKSSFPSHPSNLLYRSRAVQQPVQQLRTPPPLDHSTLPTDNYYSTDNSNNNINNINNINNNNNNSTTNRYPIRDHRMQTIPQQRSNMMNPLLTSIPTNEPKRGALFFGSEYNIHLSPTGACAWWVCDDTGKFLASGALPVVQEGICEYPIYLEFKALFHALNAANVNNIKLPIIRGSSEFVLSFINSLIHTPQAVSNMPVARGLHEPIRKALLRFHDFRLELVSILSVYMYASMYSV